MGVHFFALPHPSVEEQQSYRAARNQAPPVFNRDGVFETVCSADAVEQMHTKGKLEPQINRRHNNYEQQMMESKSILLVAGYRIVLRQ